MEKEIEQTLQEMRRQSEIRRLQMLQEQVSDRADAAAAGQ